MIRTDVTVVGAGPAGLFAVFACGQLSLRCCIVDPLAGPGGQCATLYPEKPIYDIPGFRRIDGVTLTANLAEQAAQYEPVCRWNETICSLVRSSDEWQARTDKGTTLQSKAVIIAAGSGSFTPTRPQIPSLKAFEAESVRYWVRDKQEMQGRRIVIAGGGDSAVDWALALTDVAAKIYLVHRRREFRASPDSLARLLNAENAGAVELVVPFQLAALQGKSGRLAQVVVTTLTGQTRVLEADYLLPMFGLSANLGPLENWGLILDGKRVPVAPESMQTNLDGVYAIGDIAAYPGKLKLILTGFSEAAIAAHAAYERVHDGRKPVFEYSTSRGVPS